MTRTPSLGLNAGDWSGQLSLELINQITNGPAKAERYDGSKISATPLMQ